MKTARTAATLLAKASLSKEEATAAANAARDLLIRVSNCDGLNILGERLSKAQMEDLAAQYQRSRDANVPLLKWVDTIRTRRVAS